jgi:putative restriction endonuclease
VVRSPYKHHDAEVRLAAFDWLSRQTSEQGDVLPRESLAKGFEYKGQRVPLIGPQGMFKPKMLSEVPLSITTAPHGPYDDSFDKDGFLLYKYRGTDPKHHENVGLRKAMFRRTPLVYFHGVVPGKYLSVWPVFIVGDLPEAFTFKVAADEMTYLSRFLESENSENTLREDDSLARRAYITSSVRQRLHQRGFRERVLAAYKDQCAFCRLRHRELLDAAHIIPDNQPGGDPIVRNGIALCKLHHAAYDSVLLGIRPDYIIQVRKDVLIETDGPMLRHGLQGLHNTRITIPRRAEHRPSPDLLERRWKIFETVA